MESGFATLTVGDTTQTTLAAAPNPVTPPAKRDLDSDSHAHHRLRRARRVGYVFLWYGGFGKGELEWLRRGDALRQ